MEAGGSERQLLYLLQGLDRARFEPILYLVYRTGSLLTEVPSDVQVISFWDNHHPPRWNWPGRIHAMQIAHLANVLTREEIDVVYDRLFHMTLVAGPATHRARVPRVSTIVSPPQFDLERSEKRWRWWKRRALARAYSTASKLLTVSTGTADAASEYYAIPRGQYEVVPSPIDNLRIRQLAIEPIESGPWDSAQKHILAVGRLSEEKGHTFLIDAIGRYFLRREMAKTRIATQASDTTKSETSARTSPTNYDQGLPEIQLHIAGDGPLREALKQQIDRLGLQNHVILHGYVRNPYAMMQRADLFVMPSIYEGLPNALLEAMACGVPVLASDTEQGPGELLRSIDLGTRVPIADPEALCAAIHDRFAREEAWLAKAQLAKSYVEEQHSLSHWLDRMSLIFVESASSSSNRKQSL
jgi:glycosyltransferase involved in cell wall biosynthesis